MKMRYLQLTKRKMQAEMHSTQGGKTKIQLIAHT